MDLVEDIAALRQRIRQVRRGPAYTTSLFATDDQLDGWTTRGETYCLASDRAVLTLRRDRDFLRLYHVAEDQSALADTLARLPAGTYVADLIGRDDPLDVACATYAACGFVAHSFLRRMVRLQAPSEPGAGEAAVATPADAGAIAAFLDRLLDPLTEQIPDTAELEREAATGQLLVTRADDASVTGMLLYDLKAAAAQLRFWHVDPVAHGQGIGRRLMTAFLTRCAAARRLVLWVIGDNDRSIAIYQRYGFAADGLLDRIMVLRKEARA